MELNVNVSFFRGNNCTDVCNMVKKDQDHISKLNCFSHKEKKSFASEQDRESKKKGEEKIDYNIEKG